MTKPRKGLRRASTGEAPAFLGDGTFGRLTEELRRRREHLAAQHASAAAARRGVEGADAHVGELFDLMPLPAFLMDANGTVWRANLSAASMLETERKRLIGSPFLVFVQDMERRLFLDYMQRCRHSERAVAIALALKPRSGKPVPVHLSSRVVGSASESNRLFLTTALDLREQMRAETQRLQALAERDRIGRERERYRAANESKDRFLAMLSHELRAPLTPILLATSTWKDDPSVPEHLRRALAMIHRNAEVEARLIDDLLDLSRIAQKKLRLDVAVVDPHAVIDEALNALQGEAAAAQVSLVRDDAPSRHVLADALRLRQIVTNLVRNAIRVTPPGGAVTVATADGLHDMVRIVVRDTGIGFDEATRARMFEAFDQGPRRESGALGLGLAICKGLVDAQGGTITAYSAGLARGAELVVELPATHQRAERPPEPEAPAATPPTPLPDSGLRILLVEDHEDTGTALAMVLELEGYQVKLAHCVAEALAAAARSEVDIVVSDLGLPDGSGLDLIRTLRAKHAVRGIALTGYGRAQDREDACAAGFDAHLTKPVEVTTLVATIEALRRRSA